MPASTPGDGLEPGPREFRVGARAYTLRRLGPDDAARLQEFFHSHTRETIQLRYGHAVARMTPERAFELVNVDQTRDLALTIVERVGPRDVIHAVGRYYVDTSGTSGEVAFVVHESCRRRGFATRLMQMLVDTARRRGLTSLWGHVRRDNLPMLALFRRFGGGPVPGAGSAEPDLAVRMPLGPPAPPARPSPAPPGPPRRRLRRKPSPTREV